MELAKVMVRAAAEEAVKLADERKQVAQEKAWLAEERRKVETEKAAAAEAMKLAEVKDRAAAEAAAKLADERREATKAKAAAEQAARSLREQKRAASREAAKLEKANAKVNGGARLAREQGRSFMICPCEVNENMPNLHVLIAAQESLVNVAGYVAWEVTASGVEAEICSLAIRHDLRQQGLGSRLLAYALGTLCDAGFHSFKLHVRCGNTAALALYRKYGFREESVVQGYYPDEDAIRMRRISSEHNSSRGDAFCDEVQTCPPMCDAVQVCPSCFTKNPPLRNLCESCFAPLLAQDPQRPHNLRRSSKAEWDRSPEVVQGHAEHKALRVLGNDQALRQS
eukprot:gnl/TRDRNA2_/TRDRNA2_75077_c0_seq1.p1 gnl/TRDRNA2_/TRDRNA2_75077_c0~~gnl/TRDRNA2_/TRDRNA2_75077_c0_seq1.p1  ORF type:complete len:354 (-),score=77.15 gnl/TRDRNA2_/TRDRNA2_75077_c0_seq1:388-1407(-)